MRELEGLAKLSGLDLAVPLHVTPHYLTSSVRWGCSPHGDMKAYARHLGIVSYCYYNFSQNNDVVRDLDSRVRLTKFNFSSAPYWLRNLGQVT